MATSVNYVEDRGQYKIYRRPVPRFGVLQISRGQSPSGYGNKITTDYVVQLDGEKIKRRVYAICHSNVASHYILVKGERLFIRTSWGQSEIPDEPK